MERDDGKMLDKCPKNFLAWGFVVAGMTLVFLGYVIYSNLAGNADSLSAYRDSALSPPVEAGNLKLVEHINEEGDYEKPVCKRLTEEGER
jgi:hypothetical protein